MFRATGQNGLSYLVFIRESETESSELKCPCGMVLSPVAPGELITYDECGTRLIFDVAYGCLPNGVTVIGIIDKSYDAFPREDKLTCRLLLDPYLEGEITKTDNIVLTIIIPEDESFCHMCGSAINEESKECEEDLSPE